MEKIWLFERAAEMEVNTWIGLGQRTESKVAWKFKNATISEFSTFLKFNKSRLGNNFFYG